VTANELADRLAEIDAAMTPGPWNPYTDFPDHGGIARGHSIAAGPLGILDSDGPHIANRWPWSEQGTADFEGITALRNALPDIVAALREKRVRAVFADDDAPLRDGPTPPVDAVVDAAS